MYKYTYSKPIIETLTPARVLENFKRDETA